MENDQLLDVAVIGGGIAGIIFLKRAVEKKLNVRLLERQSGVGGKWRELPSWQDIQMRPQDWSLNGVPIRGVRQPFILENAQNWVEKYQLHPYLSLSTAVEKINWDGAHWVIHTHQGEIRARYVVVATGVLNEPNLPEVSRTSPKVTEYHSSQFHDLSLMRGKRVVIVGGAHSAWDLLDHALEQEAAEIHWIYRHPRWMVPTSRPKYERTDVRRLALGQFTIGSVDKLSKQYQEFLTKAYHHFGIDEIMPKGSFHLQRNLLVGGRHRMIADFKKIRRYPGVIDAIEGEEIRTGESRIKADLVVYATGYQMNMKFLNLPLLDAVKGQEELGARCKLRCQSLDYPNLFFVGPTGVESNISLPLFAAMISKTVVSVIQGKTAFPDKIIPHPIVHWDLIKELAAFDRANYSRFWRLKYLFLAWFYCKFPNRQIRF